MLYKLVSASGVTRDFRRVLRGGSWINNQNNCRAANRNRNNPNNRNNNIGFRLCLSSHIVLRPCVPLYRHTQPELSADQGLRAEAGLERWRGLVPSARLAPSGID